MFMKIKSLHLRAFRGIEDMVLDFDDHLNVIAGENGVGKSTILDAVSMILSGLFHKIGFIDHKKTHAPDSSDTKVGHDRCEILAKMVFFGSEIEVYVDSTGEIGYAMDFEIAKKTYTPAHLNDPENRMPAAVHYRTNRYVTEVPIDPYSDFKVDRRDAHVFPLSSEVVDFEAFFEWFRNTEDFENEERVRDSSFRDRDLDAVRESIYFITGFSNMRIMRKRLSLQLEKLGDSLDIRKFSDGEKGLVAMVGDLARRLSIANPGSENPLHEEGVVLIDEMELHLHPAKQRRIIRELQVAFPNCQFFISTHSPQVLGEVSPENIILLRRAKKGNVEAVVPGRSFGLDSNIILEDLMGAPSQNEEVERALARIFVLIDKEKFAEAKKAIGNLRKKVGIQLPGMTRAETLIAALE